MTCKNVHRTWSENTDEGVDTALYSEDDWISNYEYKILYSQLPNYIITPPHTMEELRNLSTKLSHS